MGTITDKMYPYILFSSNRVPLSYEKACRDASCLYIHSYTQDGVRLDIAANGVVSLVAGF